MTIPGSLSPDGWWLWDGTGWIPAVSPDGSWRWNGSVWIPFRSARPPSLWPKLLVVLAAIAALGFGGLVAIDAWMLHGGCGSIDPTDPNNYSTVSIRNDTHRVVVISDCEGAYCDPSLVTLAPGEAAKVNAACAASGSDMTSWRISTGAGATIGYIAVDTPRKRDGLVYPVSHASTRRDLASSPGA
jgi:hypothetical protein